MKKLIHYANEYTKQSDWKTIALLKFCLCSVGILLGVAAPKKVRKPLVFASIAVFISSWIPLMAKFLHVVHCDKKQDSVEQGE